MSDDAVPDEEVRLESDALTLDKRASRSSTAYPVFEYRIDYRGSSPGELTLAESLPPGVDAEDVEFHPDFHGDNWSCDGERAVFEIMLPEARTVETKFGLAVDDPEVARAALSPPEVTVADLGSGEEIASLSAADAETGVPEDGMAPVEPEPVSDAVRDIILGPGDDPEEPSDDAPTPAADASEGDEPAVAAANEDAFVAAAPGEDRDADGPAASADGGDASATPDASGGADAGGGADANETADAGDDSDADGDADAIAAPSGGVDAGGDAGGGASETESADADAAADTAAEPDAETEAEDADDEAAAEPDPRDAEPPGDDLLSTAVDAVVSEDEENDDASDEPGDGEEGSAGDTAPSVAAGGVGAALAAELRAGELAEEDVELLRERLNLGLAESDAVRLRDLQTRYHDLAAYTDALEAFVDEHGDADGVLADLQDDVDRLEDDLDELAGAGDRLDDLEERLDERPAPEELTDRLDAVAADVDAVEERLDERVDEVERRLADLEATVADLEDQTEVLLELQDVFGGD